MTTNSSTINWDISQEDFKLIVEIAERAKRELVGYPDDKRTLIMDLNACHANGCPLDLKGLLAADGYEFSHDIVGIRKAINRRTGQLTEDYFMPRYALANHVPESHDGFGIRDEAAIAQEEEEA